MRWKSLIILFCIYASIAFGQIDEPFTVTVSPPEQYVLINETAFFDVTISNHLSQADQFTIYSPDVEWDVHPVLASDRVILLPTGGSKTIQVSVRPLYVTPGLFGIQLNVKGSKSDMLKKIMLFTGVSSIEAPKNYLPALSTELRLADKIDPREELPFTLTIKNRNRKYMDKVQIKLISALIQKEEVISLDPLEEKQINFSVQLPPLTPPQEDMMKTNILFQEDGKTYHFDAKPQTFSIIPYGEILPEKTSMSNFFKYTDTIIFKNTGNDKKSIEYHIEATFLKNLFITTSTLSSFSKKDGKPAVIIPITLDVQEETTVVVIKNYRSLFWILLALIIVTAIYQFYKSPIVLLKRYNVIATQEGGAKELKILISVRNRGPQAIEDINILDKIPSMVLLVREFEVGTLAPYQVLKHEEKGTLLKWRIDRLEKFEERIISYHVKTKLAVLGELTLPPAVAKYKKLNGRENVVNSSVKTE